MKPLTLPNPKAIHMVDKLPSYRLRTVFASDRPRTVRMRFRMAVVRDASRLWVAALAVGWSALGGSIATTAGERDPIEFGFSGPEIFPVDIGISQLRAADVNGDGRIDLLVVNNARSKINLLINRTGDDKAIKRCGNPMNCRQMPDSRSIPSLRKSGLPGWSCMI